MLISYRHKLVHTYMFFEWWCKQAKRHLKYSFVGGCYTPPHYPTRPNPVNVSEMPAQIEFDVTVQPQPQPNLTPT